MNDVGSRSRFPPNPSLNVDEAGLTEEIKGYVDLRLDKFEEHLDWLTGRTQRTWTQATATKKLKAEAVSSFD
jgi:hypothetical protein